MTANSEAIVKSHSEDKGLRLLIFFIAARLSSTYLAPSMSKASLAKKHSYHGCFRNFKSVYNSSNVK